MCDRATGSRRVSSHPRWAALYAVTLPQLIALAVVEAAGSPNTTRILTGCALVIGTFVGIAWWLRVNRAAFDLQQWCECAPRTIIVRVIESRRPASLERREPTPAVTVKMHELVHV
jgi:hypothetical protein